MDTDLAPAFTELPIRWALGHSKEPPSQAPQKASPESFSPPPGAETTMEEPSLWAERKDCCDFYLLPQQPWAMAILSLPC